MNSKLLSVVFFIAVLVVGILLGMFLMNEYQSASDSKLQMDHPCMEVRMNIPGSNPNSWATDPFTFSPVEHGIYYREQQEEERDDGFEL